MARGLTWVAFGGVVLGVCIASDVTAPLDPMLVAEIAAFVLLAAFMTRLALAARQVRALSGALQTVSEPASRFGVPYHRLRTNESAAFAVGMVRPRIYLSAGLEDRLSAQELRAILLHEEHHRSTRAPLRGACIDAWLAILGRLGSVRDRLNARLVNLECLADAHALTRGIAPAVLASALVKTSGGLPAPAGARGSSDLSDARVLALLDAAAGRPAQRSGLPLEWLPVAVAFVLVLGCHLVAVTVLGVLA